MSLWSTSVGIIFKTSHQELQSEMEYGLCHVLFGPSICHICGNDYRVGVAVSQPSVKKKIFTHDNL